MSVAGRKDGLPEFSTNHQTTHWLQHWLMKYLSRQSHITCFSFLSFSQTASEKLCCVCMNPDQRKASRVSLNFKKTTTKKTTQKRTGGEAKIWTNLIVRKETGLTVTFVATYALTQSQYGESTTPSIEAVLFYTADHASSTALTVPWKRLQCI